MLPEDYRQRLLLGGEWVKTDASIEVRSPYSGAVVGISGSADHSLLNDALAAARTGAGKMRDLPRFLVADGLRRISAGIDERAEEIAGLIASECAKPMIYARGEVQRAVATFAWAASEAERFAGDSVPLDTQASGKGKRGWSLRIPKGVVYGITPFNFPLNLVAHKVAPALAAGNSIVIKPSPRTPLTALLLGEIFLESGLPESALQVIPMDVGLIGDVLADERVAMISFTGSDKVGWDLKAKAGKRQVALELGGNAPLIVDETSSVFRAVRQAALGAFAFSGQVCISVQRILVHDEIADEFTESMVRIANDLRVGDPLDASTQLSVMIDEEAAKRAETWIGEAVGAGARVLCGNKREGAMLSATLLTDVEPEMRVVEEEAFAPLACVERFSDFDEAIERANRSRYGLQAGVFTEDLGRAMYAAENLEYGGVIINDVPSFRVDNMPYGGVKDSGFGREGLRYAMEEMSDIRLVAVSG